MEVLIDIQYQDGSEYRSVIPEEAVENAAGSLLDDVSVRSFRCDDISQ